MDLSRLSYSRPGVPPSPLPGELVALMDESRVENQSIVCLALPCTENIALPLAVHLVLERMTAGVKGVSVTVRPGPGDACKVEPNPEVWTLVSGPQRLNRSSISGRYYTLDGGDAGVRRLAEEEAFRLARTTKQGPLPKKSTRFDRWRPSPLELLVQRRMVDDPARNRCHLILVAPKARTVEQIQALRVHSAHAGALEASKLLSWGEFDQEASHRDLFNATAAPISNILPIFDSSDFQVALCQ